MGKKQKENIVQKHVVQVLYFLFLPLSLLLYFFALTRGMTLAYVGYNAWNFNIYSLIAHNYLVFGLLPTKFAPIISIGKTLPVQPNYYLHHPQLLSIIQALCFYLFGESFGTGRLPVLLATSGSLIFLYLIAKRMWGRIEAIVSVIIACLLPGYILFGRMIGQEALVLFFVLFTLYWIIRYLADSQKKYLLILSGGIVLGVLSDWPMVYFILCLFPYLWQKKRIKLWIYCLFLALGVAICFLGYIYFLMGSFADLQQAFFTRSLSHVTTLSYWPIKWFMTIAIRVLFYYSPVLLMLMVVGIMYSFKNGITKSSRQNTLLLSLLSFGTIHVLLYPEGSFGHPYWIIYLCPFIVFPVARVVTFGLYKKYYLVLMLLFMFSVLYLLKLENWKTKEIEANMWRIDIARTISRYIPSYTSIAMNTDSPVDYDTLLYQYRLNVQVLTISQALAQKDTIQKYVYVCQESCQLEQLSGLQQFSLKKINAGTVEIDIFNLHKKTEKALAMTKTVENTAAVELPKPHDSFPKLLYSAILSFTQMPQL